MNKKVSVVIPVYNVEKYLAECLDSVINQTYNNLQIILVDDGSTDNSGKICDEYAQKDNRIQVIHQQNAGAGAAKNAGLKVATGDYLTFADSDDYVELDAYEYMVNLLEMENADVVQCNYYDLFTDEIVESKNIKEYTSLTQIDYLTLFTSDWTCCLLWDKLYKRSLFEGILFETGHIVDDEFFTYQGIMNAKKIIRDPKAIYYYRKRKSSVTAKPEYKQRVVLDKLDYLQKRREKIAECYPQLSKNFNKHFFYMLCWLSTDNGITEESMNLIKSLIKTHKKEMLSCGLEFSLILNLNKIKRIKFNSLIEKEVKEENINFDKYFD